MNNKLNYRIKEQKQLNKGNMKKALIGISKGLEYKILEINNYKIK